MCYFSISSLSLLFCTQAVEELRRKCDQLHAHLLEIELAYAHKPQIKALNVQQVPAEIEQAKVSTPGTVDIYIISSASAV